MFQGNEKGQSLIEVLVVGVVSAIMILALIVIILNSLKNAQFAQNQTQATKLAQDTIDKIRILRDNNANSTLIPTSGPAVCFKELWNNTPNTDYSCGGSNPTINFCYYKLTSNTTMTFVGIVNNSGVIDTLSNGFTRQIKVSQPSPGEANVTVIINWNDSSGAHSSDLETVITKPNYDCI